MTHKGPFQPLLFCDSVIYGPNSIRVIYAKWYFILQIINLILRNKMLFSMEANRAKLSPVLQFYFSQMAQSGGIVPDHGSFHGGRS